MPASPRTAAGSRRFPEPVYLAWSEFDPSATVKGWGGSNLYSCRECGDGFKNCEEEDASIHSALHQRAEAAQQAAPLDDADVQAQCRCIPIQPGGECGCPCHRANEDEPTGDLAVVAPAQARPADAALREDEGPLGPPERPGWIGVRLRDAFWRDDYYITGKYNHHHPDHTTVAHDYREETCRFTLIEPIYPYDRNLDDRGATQKVAQQPTAAEDV